MCRERDAYIVAGFWLTPLVPYTPIVAIMLVYMPMMILQWREAYDVHVLLDVNRVST